MAAIEANVAVRGAQICFRNPVNTAWQSDPAALAAIEEADLILVNGEGTIHHGKHAAVNLAQLGPHCRARGKPCFLINATLQANNQAIVTDLAAFDAIWVREGRSAQDAKSWGLTAEVCGDLSFFHDLPHHEGGEDRGLVLDSADPRITAELAGVAARLKADFVAMRHNRRGMKAYKKQPLRWRYETSKPTATFPGIVTFRQFAAHLARRPFLVTGRFHGLCFAVNSRIPFSAVSLGVWKSDAVLADIGLHPARLFQPGAIPQPFTSSELDQLDAYLSDVRGRIAAMFDRILPSGEQVR
ncbi:polysaccharide pyruvyl transferase family protein [Dongia deserti]|uniref:polysaccharide pyruvyl transferase family protein n=1 Tax=Dongia deserti TaxID=2268030 RepID=UPI000E64DF9C|nr:polysaccharide pyruvyl transferase family protein [Dongia deserti]